MNFLKRFNDIFVKNLKLKNLMVITVFIFGVLFISSSLFFANNTDNSFPQEYKIISPKIPNHVQYLVKVFHLKILKYMKELTEKY